MKTKYEKLDVEVIRFECQDVVRTSDVVMEWDIFSDNGTAETGWEE